MGTYRKAVAPTAHTPVLLQEAIETLNPVAGTTVVDGTIGGGGHAEAILPRIGTHGRYIGIDADARALERVRMRLGSDPRLTLIHGNMRNLASHLARIGCTHVDRIILDLGLSSDQLSAAEGEGRGFSFTHDEPLVMTLAYPLNSETLTAEEIVNTWSEESIADILYGFGGERAARRIARAIVEVRAQTRITTTKQCADIIARVVPRRGPTHPATRTFQALRIAVNDELGALTDTLAAGIDLLVPGGRMVVITFHSLEDRVVKRTFAAWKGSGRGTLLTPHPMVPSMRECAENRRARSAKLRGFCVSP